MQNQAQKGQQPLYTLENQLQILWPQKQTHPGGQILVDLSDYSKI